MEKNLLEWRYFICNRWWRIKL